MWKHLNMENIFRLSVLEDIQSVKYLYQVWLKNDEQDVKQIKLEPWLLFLFPNTQAVYWFSYVIRQSHKQLVWRIQTA